jgi:hypothetical protein
MINEALTPNLKALQGHFEFYALSFPMSISEEYPFGVIISWGLQ